MGENFCAKHILLSKVDNCNISTFFWDVLVKLSFQLSYLLIIFQQSLINGRRIEYYSFASILVSIKSNVNLKPSLKTKTEPTHLLNLEHLSIHISGIMVRLICQIWDLAKWVVFEDPWVRVSIWEDFVPHTFSGFSLITPLSFCLLSLPARSTRIHSRGDNWKWRSSLLFQGGRSHYLHYLTQMSLTKQK